MSACFQPLEAGALRRRASAARTPARRARLAFAAALAVALHGGAAAGAQPPPPTAVMAGQPEGTRFITVGVGLVRAGDHAGLAGTLGVAWRWQRVLTTVTPLDLVIRMDTDEYNNVELSGGTIQCVDRATGRPAVDARCGVSVRHGVSAETGLLLGGAAAPVWLGGGYHTGGRSAAYGALAIRFRFREATHLQVKLRGGRRYAQATFGVGGAF